MSFGRDFRDFLKSGADVADAAPVGVHTDGTPCYTNGCSRGGIPWKNILKHNAMEKAQMKFDFSGKAKEQGPKAEHPIDLKRLSEEELKDYMHKHEDAPESPEFKAFLAEIDRREKIYRDDWERSHS